MKLRIGDFEIAAPGPQAAGSTKVRFGYAFTEIDGAVWDAWLKANHDSDLLRNKVLFGSHSLLEVENFCIANRRGVRTGMEQATTSGVALPANPGRPFSVG